MVANSVQQKWNEAGENVVVLHQFKRAKKCPSFSPYCLKLETFLKMHNIEYIHEEEHALKGPSKTAPWITFNGENIPDSQKCIDLLASKLEIDLFKGMSEEDKAISNSFKIMIEDRLIPCVDIERFYWKKWDDYKDLIPPFTPPALNFLSSTLWNMLGKGSKKKWGVGALPKEKLEEATSGYLDTLSKFLGAKKFMFGDEITLIDIIIFGVMTLFYYCTPESSKMMEIANSFSNLKEHNQRMKEKIYPDGFENPPKDTVDVPTSSG